MIPDSSFAGQSPQAGEKEYAFSVVTQIKLNEKLLAEYEAEAEKWEKRAALARGCETPEGSGGTTEALAAEAEARAAAVQSKAAALRTETAELRAEAERVLRSLPALAARERSVDPDLLLQELLIAAGHDPGSEEERGRERQFAEMEKNAAADAALAELKAKMGNP
ncbi:MAG: chromosome partitioning protein [Treponema sp.]|jgi:phage shock protein A|nr:chromosome partitioning protein [Treponema sp.]